MTSFTAASGPLDDDSLALVADCIELIGEQLLEHAYEMVDEVDAVLQRAEYGGNE